MTRGPGERIRNALLSKSMTQMRGALGTRKTNNRGLGQLASSLDAEVSQSVTDARIEQPEGSMNCKGFVLAFAVLCHGVGIAATTSTNGFTVTYDEKTFSAPTLMSSLSEKTAFFTSPPASVVNGVGSFEFLASASNDLPLRSTRIQFGLNLSPLTSGSQQLVLSKGLLKAKVSIFDADTSELLKSSDFEISSLTRYDIGFRAATAIYGADGFSDHQSFRYEISYDFNPGYYLAASNDPTCASLSCMQLKQDELLPFVSISVNQVPEPSTYALMLGGLALMGAMARRRAG
ncbi:PEP-CTERM sorting domain-containing protein [Aquincola sp. J276]|nr:PEP-CTERM sorting domain-containing protein [Aquincola sp. J276]MCR5864636.1 PEP-CTERM sorting domain-containing protein [Aquincola sp. J276]